MVWAAVPNYRAITRVQCNFGNELQPRSWFSVAADCGTQSNPPPKILPSSAPAEPQVYKNRPRMALGHVLNIATIVFIIWITNSSIYLLSLMANTCKLDFLVNMLCTLRPLLAVQTKQLTPLNHVVSSRLTIQPTWVSWWKTQVFKLFSFTDKLLDHCVTDTIQL